MRLRKRAGFVLVAMLMTAAAMMGMAGTYFFVHQREEARDLNTSQAMRDLVALASEVNSHYINFMESVNEEIDYYKVHGDVQAGAQGTIIAAWDSTGSYVIDERVDLVETSEEFMQRLGITDEDAPDPADGKFIDSCTVTSRVFTMLKDKVDLDEFPFDYVPGIWMVKINLKSVPGYYFSTEALYRASRMLRMFGEDNVSGSYENVNFSMTKVKTDEVELMFIYNLQSRDLTFY